MKQLKDYEWEISLGNLNYCQNYSHWWWGAYPVGKEAVERIESNFCSSEKKAKSGWRAFAKAHGIKNWRFVE